MDPASADPLPAIASGAEYVAYLREISYWWKSHDPEAMRIVDRLVEQVEEYERSLGLG